MIIFFCGGGVEGGGERDFVIDRCYKYSVEKIIRTVRQIHFVNRSLQTILKMHNLFVKYIIWL